MNRRSFLAGLTAAFALASCGRRVVRIDGAGAYFSAPLYARWRALFERTHPAIAIAYQAVGSGGGIDALTAREVHFGATDMLLNEGEIDDLPAPVLTIPTMLGAVVIAYNLPGVDGEIVLSSDVLADIYLGRIRNWDHHRIVELNPGKTLPNTALRVAYRADSSGATHIFTDYLSAVSSEWRDTVGVGRKADWPIDRPLTGEGSDGIAHQILLEPGGIGYIDLQYAVNSGLPFASLVNGAGFAVRPEALTIQSADQYTPPPAGGLLKPSIVNAPGEKSYPLAAFTYLLVYRDLGYLPPEQAEALVLFLEWCLHKGQGEAGALHYVALPAPLQARILAEIRALRNTIGSGAAALSH